MKNKYLYTGSEWDMELIAALWHHIEKIARNLGFDPYEPQMEVITSEQMLNCYSTVAMPNMYNHWSFGKTFIQNEREYNKGMQGLAYEVVINTNPCIAYLMENNTATLMALVIAHASCVDGETECLTEKGWIKISEYTNQSIAQYSEDGTIVFKKPVRYVETNTNQFLEIKAQGVSQKVTLDHTMVYRNPRGNLKKSSASDFLERHLSKTRGHNGKFITAFKYNGSGINLSNSEIKLAVAIKADGSFQKKINSGHLNCVEHNRIRFYLKKERKILRLKDILNTLGIKYTCKDTYEGIKLIVFNVPLAKYTKTFDNEWYKATKNQLEIIGEEVLYWDGDQKNSFSTTKESCANYIQFVWAALGYGTRISKYTSEGKKDCYRVNKSPYAERSISRSRGGVINKIVETEGGKAYCFTTDTGMWVARKDNCIFVTGNCGHSHFFKNNYLFKGWTDADTIVDYLKFAKKYIKTCEEKYGEKEVEHLLDACHALQNHGIDKYKKPSRISKELERMKKWEKHEEDMFNDVWRTIPKKEEKKKHEGNQYSEENLLYFIEKNSPTLKPWEKEIVRIVRKISQYFYPQRQTQLLNEGFACYTHHLLMTEMHTQGLIDDGAYLEFLQSHTNVVTQRDWDSKHYGGINVYALGFAMLKDIERMCVSPDEEDLKWFPEVCNTNPVKTVLHIVENYRDESFIQQFLSPKICRHFKLFSLNIKEGSGYLKVNGTHDDEDFIQIRKTLAAQYDLSRSIPQIEVVDVDWEVDRWLYLEYRSTNGQKLSYRDVRNTVAYASELWGFPVKIEYVDGEGNEI